MLWILQEYYIWIELNDVIAKGAKVLWARARCGNAMAFLLVWRVTLESDCLGRLTHFLQMMWMPVTVNTTSWCGLITILVTQSPLLSGTCNIGGESCPSFFSQTPSCCLSIHLYHTPPPPFTPPSVCLTLSFSLPTFLLPLFSNSVQSPSLSLSLFFSLSPSPLSFWSEAKNRQLTPPLLWRLCFPPFVFYLTNSHFVVLSAWANMTVRFG